MTADDRGPELPSVLHRPGSEPAQEPPWLRASLADLNLEPVIAALVKRGGGDVRSQFRIPLRDVADTAYRQDVFRDLTDAVLRERIEAFVKTLRGLRDRGRHARTIRNRRRAQRLALASAATYVAAVLALTEALTHAHLVSEALRGIAAYLDRYVRSEAFRTLQTDVTRLEHELEAVTYGLELLEDRVHVWPAGPRDDYGAAVERTLRAFRRDASQTARGATPQPSDMNAVEAEILDRVAHMHPEPFAALESFAQQHDGYVDRGVARFEREVAFYLSYLAYADRFEAAGLPFCLPDLSATDKRIDVRDGYDLALADTLLDAEEHVVVNDVRLDSTERIMVITGANQGGKSTYARMVGQLHYLAALGCPVPARRARLFSFRELLTHFDRPEDPSTLQGKLHDELTRLHALLGRASSGSVVILNEAFSSTSSDDALALGRATLERLLDLDALAVYVTFVDELSSFDTRVASIATAVHPEDPSRRTFELVRRPADGRAHALAVARTYGLTYEDLRHRLGS
jgi:DNA mismatch repair protein MutS